MNERPTISVLVSARRNSKYLAKFLFGYFANTVDTHNTEILVMLSEHDTWNKELMQFFAGEHRVKFMTEDYGLGRDGLHEYFNELYTRALGDWTIYFCEDHFITMWAWDRYVRQLIETRELDPDQVWCLIPKFDNCGAMNQILSRGYIEALGGVLGRHGWIDSYVNDLNAAAFSKNSDRIIRFDDEMFHDFTHDQPTPMDESHSKAILKPAAAEMLRYEDSRVRQLLEEDARKLRAAVEAES